MRSDEEAEFASLVNRQCRFAYKVAWAVLRNPHDAEDAAQETFLKVLQAGAWRGIRDERAFVARAAWRAAVDRLRQRRPATENAEDPMAEALADRSLNPEQTAIAANRDAALHRLIDSLPEEMRQPLALSAEMNSREIAAAMGIAEGTVRTRLMRARQILREKLAALEERHYARR